MTPDQIEHLLDFRKRTAALYAAVRRRRAGPEVVRAFRLERGRLLAEHPHSPLPARHRLAYFPYDPALRFELPLRAEHDSPLVTLPGSNGPDLPAQRVGRVAFEIGGHECRLAVYWIGGYVGGVFLPFSDATAGATTAPCGRYVWDSLKGADLGLRSGRLVVDFNYACHPPSVYDPTLNRPLAPPENVLDVAIRAGERLP